MDTQQTMDPRGTDASPAQQQAEATEQAKRTTRKATDQTQERIRDQLNIRSAQAGGQMQATAEDLRSVGEELRKQGKDVPARWVDQGADSVDRIGRYLTESDADKILRDLEDLARRRPWAMIAGGVALGFLATRVLKASSSRRNDAMYAGSTTGTQAAPVSGGLPVHPGWESSAPTARSSRPVATHEEAYPDA